MPGGPVHPRRHRVHRGRQSVHVRRLQVGCLQHLRAERDGLLEPVVRRHHLSAAGDLQLDRNLWRDPGDAAVHAVHVQRQRYVLHQLVQPRHGLHLGFL